MKNKFTRNLFLLILLLMIGSFGFSQTSETQNQVQSLEFFNENNQARLEVKFKNAITNVDKKISDKDKQVVFEIENVNLPKKWSRKLDTSSFNLPVVLISPYQQDKNLKIVFQLNELVDVDYKLDDKSLNIFVKNLSNNQKTNKEELKSKSENATTTSTEETNLTNNTNENQTNNQEQENKQENIDQLTKSLETKQYRGKKITLQLQNADLQDVFKVISEASDLNIVLADDVKGKVSLNLYDVPWDQVLDILLKSNKLAAEKSGNVLRIATLDAITKEKQAEASVQKAVEAVEPLLVKIFPISYAKITDLQNIIKDFLSKEPVALRGPGFQGGSETTRGSIQVDTRTNSLIVRDTATNLEKIARLIKELDTQTPQILIEAKFVEVSEQKNRDIQGKLFLTTREFDAATSQLVFNGNRSNAGAVFGGKEFISGPPLPTSFSVTPTSGAAFGFSPKNMGILPPGLRDIAAYLGILEFESSSKIIASPRVITQNKETAEISQGKAIQLAVPAGPNVAGGFQTINATLTLQVTPQVTSDGSINMKISFSQSTPSEAPAGSSFATNTKKVDTTVLVESGATLVIGGIYTSTETKSAGGIPFLRDLPLIGVLFGSKSSLNEKGEVFIFITPRILNEKEAGFQG